MVLGGAEGLPCNLEVPILNQPIVSDQAFFSGQYPIIPGPTGLFEKRITLFTG